MSQTATQVGLQPLPSIVSLHDGSKAASSPAPSSDPPDRPRLSHTHTTPAAPTTNNHYVSHARANLITAQLTLVIAMASVSTGLITTSIPRMASDLSIPPQTSYWPLSIYGLTSGASLLVAGAVADAVGAKRVFQAGCVVLAVSVLGCGLARDNTQLVLSRAVQGLAAALCMPASVAIISRCVEPGRGRNLAFACTGLGMVLGYFAGLLFGGVFIDTVGWRVGWYVLAGMLGGLFVAGLRVIPGDRMGTAREVVHALRTGVDWVGVAVASAALTLLAWVLVQLSNSQSAIRAPAIIAMLTLSFVLFGVFGVWMHVAEKKGYPVLIPNGLWKKKAFVGVCVMMLLSYAVMQTMELFCTLFFQHVQGLSAMQSSVRMVPAMVVATLLVLTTGLFIHKVSPIYLILPSSLLCAGAPLLMALAKPEWPYWYAAFPAQVLQPVCTRRFSFPFRG